MADESVTQDVFVRCGNDASGIVQARELVPAMTPVTHKFCRSGKVVRHVVMWKLKDEAEGADAKTNAVKMKDMLEALEGKIDGLLSLKVSANVFQALPETDVVLFSEHESREALDAYQVHPLHVACVDFVKKVVSDRRVVDCEL